MEEASRPIARDVKTAETLAVIPSRSSVPWEHMPREPHLLDYLIILRKHQWLIATFLLTVVTVVTIASFKMKPVYQAAARVEVDKESQNTLPFQGVNYDEYEDMENYMATQTEILARFAALSAAASCGRLSSASAPLPVSTSVNSAATSRPSALANVATAARWASSPRPDRPCWAVDTR